MKIWLLWFFFFNLTFKSCIRIFVIGIKYDILFELLVFLIVLKIIYQYCRVKKDLQGLQTGFDLHEFFGLLHQNDIKPIL